MASLQGGRLVRDSDLYYCAHCEHYHEQGNHSKVYYPSAHYPYAREAFEARRKDLKTEAVNYGNGQLTREQYEAAIQRIDADYHMEVHSLYMQGLI